MFGRTQSVLEQRILTPAAQ